MCFRFEWGCPVSLKQDEDCLDVASDDYLCTVKDDFALELYHVQDKNMTDEQDEQKFTVSCDVEVSKDLLKGLLRDRGKGNQF